MPVRWGFAGSGWDEIAEILEADPQSAADLSALRGRMSAVLPHIGWSALSPGHFVTLRSTIADPEHAGVAGVRRPAGHACAAGGVQVYEHRHIDGLFGVNLSYLVRAGFQGHGLGALVSHAAAFALMQDLFHRACEETAGTLMDECVVSAQCADDNPAGQALARKLGLTPDERFTFQIPSSDISAARGVSGLRYQGFSEPFGDFMEKVWRDMASHRVIAIGCGPTIDMIDAQRSWATGLLEQRNRNEPQSRQSHR